MAKQIISRVIAILFLSFPLGLGVIALEKQDQKAMETLSHGELIAYLSANRIDSIYGACIMFFCAGLLYLGLVEGCAYILRWAWKQFSDSDVPV